MAIERGREVCDVFRAIYPRRDVDEYRARYGVVEGEARFFRDNQASEILRLHDVNLLLCGGVSALWQCLVGNGVTGSGNMLSVFSNANTAIGVGISSTAADTSQNDLLASTGSTNRQFNAADSGFPKLYDYGTTGQGVVTVSAATNAAPIVLTTSTQSPAFNNGDFVYVWGVGGNTAANGIFQVTSVTATSLTLVGSTGNGAYTSGGYASRANVVFCQSTFGTTLANFAWNEFGIANQNPGTGTLTTATGRLLNRGVASLGTKTSSASWQFGIGIYIA